MKRIRLDLCLILMKEYNIGTAYYTDGQEVPEDITEADAEGLNLTFAKGSSLCVIRQKNLDIRC